MVNDCYKVGPPFTWCLYNYNFTGVYDTDNYSIHEVYKLTYNLGGPDCMISHRLVEVDNGAVYRKAVCLMVKKHSFRLRFSLKPIH